MSDTDVYTHVYPGVGMHWRRPETPLTTAAFAAFAGSVVGLLRGFVLPLELEVEIEGEDVHLGKALRVALPPGMSRAHTGHTADVVTGDRLRPADVVAWLDDGGRRVSGPLEEVVLRTGCVAARVPLRLQGQGGCDVLVEGERYWVPFLELDGAEWHAGPSDRIGTPPPVEVVVTSSRAGSELDVRLLWSAWELEDGGFDARVQRLVEGVGGAGWEGV